MGSQENEKFLHDKGHCHSKTVANGKRFLVTTNPVEAWCPKLVKNLRNSQTKGEKSYLKIGSRFKQRIMHRDNSKGWKQRSVQHLGIREMQRKPTGRFHLQ